MVAGTAAAPGIGAGRMIRESGPIQPPRAIRCGIYEIDFHARELRKNGRKVHLQGQPFSVLARLLDHPGELVTREELQAQLWGQSRVDSELGLNTAIKKLRAAFNDSADNPLFIETLPKRGYRFIAPVSEIEQPLPAKPTESSKPIEIPCEDTPATRALEQPPPVTDLLACREPIVLHTASPRTSWRKWRLPGIALALLVVIAGAGILAGRTNLARDRSTLSGRKGVSVFRQLRGPDGSATGIGGYDLRSPRDQAFAFDYDHSGKLDHLVLYRPGAGIIWILRNVDGRFSSVFAGHGVGAYAIKFGADRAFAFDYDHSGKRDHLVLYRLGTDTLWILKNEGEGVFTSVYRHFGDDSVSPAQNPDARDQIFAFDYTHTGKWDYLVRYRPSARTFEISTNIDGKLSTVSTVSLQSVIRDATDLQPAADQVFAFDYEHSGKPDHLVLYRANEASVVILKNTGGTFAPAYEIQGIRSGHLNSPDDRALPFDYQHTGNLDHLLLYRPGTGLFSIWQNTAGTLMRAYTGLGIGGYNLKSPNDRVLAFDYDHSGKPDHLVLYRPGTGLVQIVAFP
jgi:DNA-binding winged helix-turn-helix (wHTH) protein